jgi:hypothetical protein
MPFISVRRKTAIVYFSSFLFIVARCFFALLIGYAAGGLASRLAGGLAFAAAAVFHALLEVARLDGDNSFHTPFISLIHILHQNYHNTGVLSIKRDSAERQSQK